MRFFVGFVLLFISSWAVPQTKTTPDCSTLKYIKRTTAWLCGEAIVCAGDICGRPSMLKFDERYDVVLRDNHGRQLEAKALSYEDRNFCFEGRKNGEYQIAFLLYEKGVAQPARIFPTKYKRNPAKPNDKIYMIQDSCSVENP